MLKLLLPLDGSELSECALPHALALASAFDAEITLLRVISPAEFRTADSFSRVDWRLHRHQAQAYLESIAEAYDSPEIRFVIRIEEGRPAEVIVETARSLGIHLLVMSTHGRGAAIDFPRGGIAGKVLSTYNASVLLVSARTESTTQPKAEYERLLVPIDGSYLSECSLRVATSLAQSLGAQLNVVYVAESSAVPSILSRDPRALVLCQELAEIVHRAAERDLAEIRARLPEELRLQTGVILADETVDPLAEIARRFDPDLIIASAEMVGSANGSTRSLINAVSAVDRVPILVLSPKGIGNVFCESRKFDGPGILTADVS
jgi:nucleotide-binding universal stress UspA family protein